ncbi:MAG TPA: hypothetical protein VE954_06755 [Oligoflexus sp.]|uniref:hypothetical protein n=1 Tax=Oligoflexus sp. TaxID=1971216 RepID=UPI002D65264E|nr:hypothetical protein [Oligoflexus sp.]HYX32797.1 hypothetical protein [Oligoflexus sp.]
MALIQEKTWAGILIFCLTHVACGAHQSRPKATRLVVNYSDLSISEIKLVNEFGQVLWDPDLGGTKYVTGCDAIGCGPSLVTEEFFFAAFSMKNLARVVVVRETGEQMLRASSLDWTSNGPGDYGDFEYEVSYWARLEF